jgi:glycine betaine/proline transport system permease protein
MTDAALTSPAVIRPLRIQVWWVLLAIAVILLVAVLAAMLVPALGRWPQEWVVPFRVWLTDGFAATSAFLKPLTRSISFLLGLPLAFAEAVLFRGVLAWNLPPVPWVIVVSGVGILAHWIGGARLAWPCGLAALYLVIFGLWSEAMQTLAIVVVTVPLAAGLGLLIGVRATRSPRLEPVLNTILDVMQATPHMAYLGPVVILFGFGQVPAMLATMIFALPPMVRCTMLGIRTVPTETIEAGRMSGCTPRQLLWKVELPAAQPALLLGLNQVVMQTLALVVIASLVGASGLGQMLLFSLQQLQIGKAVEQGVAITLIAVVLDALTRSYMRKELTRHPEDATFVQRHPHLVLFAGVVLVGIALAMVVPSLTVLPKQYALSYGGPINDAVRWISKNLFAYIKPVRDWITIWMLLPLRNFYLFLPWPALIGALALVGWCLGGLRLALLPVALLGFLMISGFWTPLMLTIYLVTSCVVLCILIGVPLGVYAANSPRAARPILLVCDLLQTFPSFIYLIPVIMLFQTSDLSNVIAMLFYATVPAIRYTYLGLKRVPDNVNEAAIACGTSRFQRLWKVQLPIAFPEILLGINQTIMMALAMVAITAFIGSRDLGQEIYKALPGADTGRGLLAGLGIAFIGIIADRFIGAWAKQRKAAMGLS